jgi:hypothetical protein
MMDNVQKQNNCINIPLSETYRAYVKECFAFSILVFEFQLHEFFKW